MNTKINDLKELIQKNKTASIEDCTFCRRERCFECRHLETDKDGKGKRRCDYKGCWVYPYEEACGNFKPC